MQYAPALSLRTRFVGHICPLSGSLSVEVDDGVDVPIVLFDTVQIQLKQFPGRQFVTIHQAKEIGRGRID
jgi:hypothetical protein